MEKRVGMVDDHPTVILGVSTVVNAQPDLFLSGAAATVPDLLASGGRFDLVLLDLSLADGSSPAENIKALTKAGIPVLVYTSGDQPRLIQQAGRAGAMGMIRKSELPQRIIAAIHAVLRGEVVATADWAAAIDTDADFVVAQLSERESEVLGLYASGATAAQVAAKLFISRETVLDHLRRIRSKYADIRRPAPNKIDLFRRAVEDGIIPPDA